MKGGHDVWKQRWRMVTSAAINLGNHCNYWGTQYSVSPCKLPASYEREGAVLGQTLNNGRPSQRVQWHHQHLDHLTSYVSRCGPGGTHITSVQRKTLSPSLTTEQQPDVPRLQGILQGSSKKVHVTKKEGILD